MDSLFEFATGSKRAFRDAAEKGDLETAKSLLAGGQDVDSAGDYGATALHKAAAAGQTEMVRFFAR
jgi:ankyrin repeat protein